MVACPAVIQFCGGVNHHKNRLHVGPEHFRKLEARSDNESFKFLGLCLAHWIVRGEPVQTEIFALLDHRIGVAEHAPVRGRVRSVPHDHRACAPAANGICVRSLQLGAR